jgi:DNA (cytosine-5)-methyltransferase 1
VIGSLCSGYGGLDLAVEAVFGQPVAAWHCENDPAPSRVLDAHWPGTPNLGDLTTVDWSTVEPVDVLDAGYPCQPFSHAGKRKGTDDERHLWPYVAAAIRGIRPRIVVLENVAGHRSLGFDTVQADLAALRYDTRWTSLRAADVGAPHGRERLFILATDAAATRGGVAADTDDRTDHGQRTRPPEPRSRSVAADPGSETVRLRPGLRTHQPASVGRGRPDNHPIPAAVQWGRYGPAIRRWEHAVGRAAPNPTEPGPRGGQRLSPRFVEWMMGLPDGWVTDVPELTRNDQLGILGRGVVPQQATAALRSMLT